MRQFVVAARIQYSVDGVITTLGAASTAYFADASGLLNRTWYPILDSSVELSVDVSLPWETGSPSQEIGDILLTNGGDGEFQHVLDLLIPAQLAGLVSEVRRGYTDQSWDELPDVIFKARNASKRFDGESLIIPQRPFLEKLEKPLATQVFDETTPNPRIVNRTVPLQIGQAFQIEPLIWDAPNQVYYVASNVSNVSAVREGGARTDNFVETDFGFQLLSGSNPLQITADAIGPEPTAGVSQSAVVDWDFIAWTSDEPDGIDTTENPPEASITESAAGDEADIDVLATPTDDTGWMSIQNPIEPVFSGLTRNDAWTASGAASVEAAVVTDDGSFAEATVFGPTTLRVGSYLPALPDGDEVTGVEIEIIAEGTNTEIMLLTANQRDPGTRVAAFVDANGEVSGSGIGPASITGTKQTLTGGGQNFVGGGVGVREVVTSDDVNDPGMHFSLQVQPATAGSATVKIYQVRVKVHHRPSVDIVRLFSPASVLEPGERHTVTIESTAADIYARWGGSDASGGTLKDATDPFSTSLTRLEGAGRSSFEFVPDPGEAFFGIEFKRLNSAGTATINRIKVEKRADGLNRYKTLVPYMAGLVGLEASDIDQTMIDAHDAATGSPEMGWRIEANESMAEVLDLFARSLSGVWWPDRDGKLRSVLWTLDPNATADVTITNITVDGKPQRTRIKGNITLESDPAPEATERAVGARNWRPLRISETAGITEEFSEQERANVIEDWRVRRRANFDNLNPWPVALPTLSLSSISPATGDPAGGTSVTVTGENFDTGAASTDVTFGGTSATNITVVDSTTITCDTPSGTVGDVDVVVTQGAESDTLVDGFEYATYATYDSIVLGDNPTAYFRFEETSGIVISDDIGGPDGSVTGADLSASGAVDSGISFDGTDDHANLGPVLTQLSPGSIEFWIKTTSTSQGAAIGVLGSPSFFFQINSSNTGVQTVGEARVFYRDDSAGSDFTSFSISEDIYDGNWHHVVLVVAGDPSIEANFDVYVDASNVALSFEQSLSDDSWPASPDDLFIGAWNNSGAGSYAEVELDEVAIYDVALSSSQISDHYNAR